MLKTPLKILLAASIALPAFLAADLAQAGNNKHNRHHNSHNYSKHYGGYNYGKHYGGYNYSNRHYSHNYYPSYTYGGYYYGGHYGHGGKAGAYAGLAILGATLGYMLHKSSKDKYRGGRPGGYYAPPPQQPQSYAPTQQGNFDFSQCRETRDYETTIIVDGQEQLAYGTACLRADGNWVAGPMRIGD
ncbi:MAG: hypothetical protein IIC07_00120 [Proteobacteria bacterium]|nr:hypothetical protein [Pseudomonadota bacterium]MCH8322827.1 hypothetical protein [Pseudomonadota bacterium]